MRWLLLLLVGGLLTGCTETPAGPTTNINGSGNCVINGSGDAGRGQGGDASAGGSPGGTGIGCAPVSPPVVVIAPTPTTVTSP